MPNATGSDINKAGDYVIDKLILRSEVTGTSVNIRALFSQMEIYEDMFSPYMTAKIYMNDGLNIAEVLPVRGQETLELSFRTDFEGMEPIQKTFKIYKIDQQIIDENGRGQQYVLHLISEGGYFNYSEYCGYSVKGTVSSMVKEVFKKHFPEYLWKDTMLVQPTADNFVYVLPRTYTPFKAVTWLARRAISGVAAEYSPFFFYETVEGYRFQSLSSIIESGQANKDLYYYTNNNVNRNPETNEGSGIKTKGSLPSMYNRLQSLEETTRFDMIENIGSGIISSKLTVHDLLKKEKRDILFREVDVFENSKKMGTAPHYIRVKGSNEFFDKTSGAYSYLSTTPYTVYTNKNNIIDNDRIEEYFLQRKYLVNTMMTQKIVVDIYGDSDKRVGQLMEITVPKIAADGHLQDEKDDKNLSGDYMITSICHKIGQKYMCTVELSRNAKGL